MGASECARVTWLLTRLPVAAALVGTLHGGDRARERVMQLTGAAVRVDDSLLGPRAVKRGGRAFAGAVSPHQVGAVDARRPVGAGAECALVCPLQGCGAVWYWMLSAGCLGAGARRRAQQRNLLCLRSGLDGSLLGLTGICFRIRPAAVSERVMQMGCGSSA